jgi:hypothetical protein
VDKKQILDKIEKLIKEYKDAHLKAKHDDLSDLHNDAMVENMEARALRFIELATDNDSVFRKQAYYHDGRNKRINELIGILYAVKEEISEEPGSINTENTNEEKYNLLLEEFKCETTGLKDSKKYKCFVIMPIGKEGTIDYQNNMLVFNKLIKPCVENSGYDIECYHSDLIRETGDISRQILRALEHDDIVIADLRRNNPNVIYELCIRHAFGKRTILICSDFSQNFFHHNKYRALQYKLDGTSNQDFFRRLLGLVDEIIKNPTKSDNLLTDVLGKNFFEHARISSHKDKLHLSRTSKGGYSLGELYNLSDEDLADIDITLEFIDKNHNNVTKKGMVISASEDPLRARSGNLGLLKRKESKHIVDFPRNQVKITVAGKVLGTDEIFSQEFELAPLTIQ